MQLFGGSLGLFDGEYNNLTMRVICMPFKLYLPRCMNNVQCFPFYVRWFDSKQNQEYFDASQYTDNIVLSLRITSCQKCIVVLQ